MAIVEVNPPVLLPENASFELLQDFVFVSPPSMVFEIDFDHKRLKSSTIDGLDAIRQDIRLILSTERFIYEAHSWNYGREFVELFGRNIPGVYTDVQNAITNALIQDDRIEEVSDFQVFSVDALVFVQFTVVTTLGELTETLEVTDVV